MALGVQASNLRKSMLNSCKNILHDRQIQRLMWWWSSRRSPMLNKRESVYFSWDCSQNPCATEVCFSLVFLVVVGIVYIVARLS